MDPIDNLPSVSNAEKKRSDLVKTLVIDTIRTSIGAVISFDEYMRIALYAPSLGYYDSGGEIFGSQGDFVTAPSDGELFGKCVANECKQILRETGGNVFEYGAGSGHLIGTVCGQLNIDSDFPPWEYHVIEPSRALRERQKEQNQGLSHNVIWHEKTPDLAMNGVVIANEVLDAMPAARYVVDEGRVVELGVGYEEPDLVWKTKEGKIPQKIVSIIKSYNSGYQTERILALDLWLQSIYEISEVLVILISDYGYAEQEFFRPDRQFGTLKCHRRHIANAQPFLFPGLQDITTSVDFTHLAESATGVGFSILGFTTQERFLACNGIDKFFSESSKNDSVAQYNLAQEAKRLLLPTEMGHYVKVMALGKNFDGILAGFESDDRFRLHSVY